MHSQTRSVILQNANRNPNTFGGLLLEALIGRLDDYISEMHALDSAMDRESEGEQIQIHRDAYARFVHRRRDSKDFKPSWATDIRHYELHVILMPCNAMGMKLDESQIDSARRWLWPQSERDRSRLCHDARLILSDIRKFPLKRRKIRAILHEKILKSA